MLYGVNGNYRNANGVKWKREWNLCEAGSMHALQNRVTSEYFHFSERMRFVVQKS